MLAFGGYWFPKASALGPTGLELMKLDIVDMAGLLEGIELIGPGTWPEAMPVCTVVITDSDGGPCCGCWGAIQCPDMSLWQRVEEGVYRKRSRGRYM